MYQNCLSYVGYNVYNELKIQLKNIVNYTIMKCTKNTDVINYVNGAKGTP